VRLPGLGCMRLSTEPDRDEVQALAVLHAALDAGIELLDTADAHCADDTELGHNERLIARALASWTGDRSRLRVATKGGMTRPDGRWVPDGRARHLREACERNLAALGSDARTSTSSTLRIRERRRVTKAAEPFESGHEYVLHHVVYFSASDPGQHHAVHHPGKALIELGEGAAVASLGAQDQTDNLGLGLAGALSIAVLQGKTAWTPIC